MENQELDLFINALRNKDEKRALELLNNARVVEGIIQDAPDENLAFCLAAALGCVQVLRVLLQIEQVQQNVAIDDNYPLRMLVANGSLEEANLLLNYPAVAQKITADNCYVLHTAVTNGNLALVQKITANPSTLEHTAGIIGAIKRAYKSGHKYVLFELHNLFGNFDLMQKKWRPKLNRSLNEFLDTKVLLVQIDRDIQNGLEKKQNNAPIYSLPEELLRNISSYLVEPSASYKKSKHPLLYIFSGTAKHSLEMIEFSEKASNILKNSFKPQ